MELARAELLVRWLTSDEHHAHDAWTARLSLSDSGVLVLAVLVTCMCVLVCGCGLVRTAVDVCVGGGQGEYGALTYRTGHLRCLLTVERGPVLVH